MRKFIQTDKIIMGHTFPVRIYYNFTPCYPCSPDDPGADAEIEFRDMKVLADEQWVDAGVYLNPRLVLGWALIYLIEHRAEILANEAADAEEAKAIRAEMRRQAWRDA